MSDLKIREIFSSIQGEGLLAGRRQIFIRFAGCNLDCAYCDTDFAEGECLVEDEPGLGALRPVGGPVTPDLVISLVRQWVEQMPGAHHSISITGGEPLLSAAALEDLLPALRPLLPIHLETNGTLYEPLERVIPLLDYVSMDVKLPSTAATSRELWEDHRRFLRIAAGHGASVKGVVGAATTAEEIRRVCDLIASVDRSVPLFLQPVTLADGRTGIDTGQVLALQAEAAALLPDVRVIPQMHKSMGVL